MSLHSKLHQVQSVLHTVNKSGTNTFSKYSYVTLADMLVPIRPYLEKLNLTLTQSIEHLSSDMVFVETGYYTKAAVICTTTLTDVETGESISVQSPGFSADKAGDKACYKAITGARKYGVSALFALEWFSIEPEDDKYDDKRFTASSSSEPQSRGFTRKTLGGK